MADDDIPPDLIRDIEEAFGDGRHAKAFRKRDMPSADELCEMKPADLKQVDDPYDQEAEGSSEDWDGDWQPDSSPEVRLAKALRVIAALCLALSLLLLYGQWNMSMGAKTKFRFDLGNTWPALVSVGLLVGLYLQQVIEWVRHQVFMLGQRRHHNSLFVRWKNWRDAPKWQHSHCHCWRCQRFSRTHWNVCKCLRCKFKRRWPYWRRLRRYWHR